MTIKEEQSKKAMEEFYNFIFAENVRDVETSKEFLEKIKQLEEALKILSEKTSEFTNVNKEEILAVIEDDNLEKIILFFRVLTAVSRMNMETYFVSDLCASGVFEPKIKEKDGEAVEREIKFGEKTTNMPKYDNLISMSKEHNVILKAMLDFFEVEPSYDGSVFLQLIEQFGVITVLTIGFGLDGLGLNNFSLIKTDRARHGFESIVKCLEKAARQADSHADACERCSPVHGRPAARDRPEKRGDRGGVSPMRIAAAGVCHQDGAGRGTGAGDCAGGVRPPARRLRRGGRATAVVVPNGVQPRHDAPPRAAKSGAGRFFAGGNSRRGIPDITRTGRKDGADGGRVAGACLRRATG